MRGGPSVGVALVSYGTKRVALRDLGLRQAVDPTPAEVNKQRLAVHFSLSVA